PSAAPHEATASPHSNRFSHPRFPESHDSARPTHASSPATSKAPHPAPSHAPLAHALPAIPSRQAQTVLPQTHPLPTHARAPQNVRYVPQPSTTQRTPLPPQISFHPSPK